MGDILKATGDIAKGIYATQSVKLGIKATHATITIDRNSWSTKSGLSVSDREVFEITAQISEDDTTWRDAAGFATTGGDHYDEQSKKITRPKMTFSLPTTKTGWYVRVNYSAKIALNTKIEIE